MGNGDRLTFTFMTHWRSLVVCPIVNDIFKNKLLKWYDERLNSS